MTHICIYNKQKFTPAIVYTIEIIYWVHVAIFDFQKWAENAKVGRNECYCIYICESDPAIVYTIETVCGHLPTFCPLLKTKVASKKPLKINGLRALCPLAHFFFLFYKKIKLKNIKEFAKKSGQVGRGVSIVYTNLEYAFYLYIQMS